MFNPVAAAVGVKAGLLHPIGVAAHLMPLALLTVETLIEWNRRAFVIA